MGAKEIAEYQMIYGSDPPFQKLAKAYLDLLEQNRWIPVSERLPEPMQNCLICGGEKLRHIAWAFFNTAGEWIASDNNHKYTQVTHWKPLPNVPEE